MGIKDLETMVRNLLEEISVLESKISEISKPLEETSQTLPSATQSLQDIITYTENITHQLMSITEEIQLSIADISKRVDFLLKLNPTQRIKQELEAIKEKGDFVNSKILEMMSLFSFQDLVSQQLQIVIDIIADIKKKLIELAVYSAISEDTMDKEKADEIKGKVSEILNKERVSQDDIDKLMEELGL